MPLAVSGATHQGRRATNEDAWLADLDLGLLVVADGMGGHNAGEVASALAVKTIREFLHDAHTSPTPALLEQAVELANQRILAAAAREPDLAGMGTTVVAVLVSSGRAYYMSVGDSRIYLWHGGQLKQLTRDDSWLEAALEGESAIAFMGSHPMRHVLTKVVGLRPELQTSAAECPLRAGDSLLLCSDGVHGVVSHDTLQEMLSSPRPVADIAQSVIRLAMAKGATDNVTAVIARVGGESDDASVRTTRAS